MNAGLPQGFVRFGTTAHLILVHLAEVGETSQVNLQEELGFDAREVGMNLTRLRRHKFIRKLGRLDGYLFECRTQAVYTLFHSGIRADIYVGVKNKTTAERTRKYRAKLASAKVDASLRVPSVFNFKGEFHVKDLA